MLLLRRAMSTKVLPKKRVFSPPKLEPRRLSPAQVVEKATEMRDELDRFYALPPEEQLTTSMRDAKEIKKEVWKLSMDAPMSADLHHKTMALFELENENDEKENNGENANANDEKVVVAPRPEKQYVEWRELTNDIIGAVVSEGELGSGWTSVGTTLRFIRSDVPDGMDLREGDVHWTAARENKVCVRMNGPWNSVDHGVRIVVIDFDSGALNVHKRLWRDIVRVNPHVSMDELMEEPCADSAKELGFVHPDIFGGCFYPPPWLLSKPGATLNDVEREFLFVGARPADVERNIDGDGNGDGDGDRDDGSNAKQRRLHAYNDEQRYDHVLPARDPAGAADASHLLSPEWLLQCKRVLWPRPLIGISPNVFTPFATNPLALSDTSELTPILDQPHEYLHDASDAEHNRFADMMDSWNAANGGEDELPDDVKDQLNMMVADLELAPIDFSPAVVPFSADQHNDDPLSVEKARWRVVHNY
jgi:hypothetical protein